jgi:hypothetical protein
VDNRGSEVGVKVVKVREIVEEGMDDGRERKRGGVEGERGSGEGQGGAREREKERRLWQLSEEAEAEAGSGGWGGVAYWKTLKGVGLDDLTDRYPTRIRPRLGDSDPAQARRPGSGPGSAIRIRPRLGDSDPAQTW